MLKQPNQVTRDQGFVEGQTLLCHTFCLSPEIESQRSVTCIPQGGPDFCLPHAGIAGDGIDEDKSQGLVSRWWVVFVVE